MTPKPLPVTKARSLLETFKKTPADLAIYATKGLSDQQRKELLSQPNSWIVVGKSKWT
jgi:hypothetical protein